MDTTTLLIIIVVIFSIWWRLVRPRPLVLSNFASRSVQCPQANYPPIAGAIESSKAVSVRATSASGEKHSCRKSCAAVGKRRAGRKDIICMACRRHWCGRYCNSPQLVLRIERCWIRC